MLFFIKRILRLFIGVFVLGFIISFLTLWYFSAELPDYKILSTYKPSISSRVHSGEGQLIAEYALQKRLFIPYETIPKKVVRTLEAPKMPRPKESLGQRLPKHILPRYVLRPGQPFLYEIPKDIKITVEKSTVIKIQGIDKESVGRVASEIKSLKPVEPYKAKGIKERGQYVLRKEGKKK